MHGPMKTATERYLNDPVFARLVDTLQNEIENGHYTPSELREAVILAATKYEYRNLRPMIYGHDPEMQFWCDQQQLKNTKPE